MLEEGRIIRNQVTYDSLSPAEWGVLEKETEKVAHHEEEVEEEDEQRKKITRQQSSAGTIEKGPTEADMARQTGDTECYKIYLRSMGWKFLLSAFCLMVGHTVLEIMPRK